MNERRARAGLVLALVVEAFLLGVGAESLPLLDPDEARFARTSVEMMRSRDLVVPTYEGRPRLVKPPLLHWIQSALFRTFGASELVARLPAAAATLLALYLTAWIARRRFGHEGGLWAAAILGTMPLVVAVGRLGTLDALLSLHVLAVVALDVAEPEETRGHRALAIGLLTGLAFLIKGPVGVVLPLLLMLAGRTAAGREILPRPLALLEGGAGWCLVVLPWGLALVARVGWTRVLDTLRGEAMERYFLGTDHPEPAWFCLAALAAGTAPWFLPALVGLVRALARRDDPATRTAVYAAAALVAGLVFFSIGRSKLPTYVLPLTPLVAILATWELGQELNAPRERWLGPLLLCGTLGAAGLGLGLATGLGLAPVVRIVAVAGALLYGTGAAVALGGILARHPRWVYGVTAVVTAAFLLTAVALLLPEVARRRSSAYLLDAVPQLREADRPVVIVDMKVPSLTYYLDRVPEEVDLADFESRLDRPDDPVIVFDEGDVPRATQKSTSRLREVGRQGKYVVYEKRKEGQASEGVASDRSTQ